MTIDEINKNIDTLEDNKNNTADQVRKVLKNIVTFADDGLKKEEHEIAAISTDVGILKTDVSTLKTDRATVTSVTTLSTRVDGIEHRVKVLEEKLANPNQATLMPFHIWSKDPIVATQNSVQLWYSFKGLAETSSGNAEKAFGFHVNFTFKLRINNKMTSPLAFDIDDELLAEYLKQIVASNKLNYVVPVTNTNESLNATPKIITVNLAFTPKKIIFSFFNHTETKLISGDEIFTSIHFHCPSFDFNSEIKVR